MKLMNKIYVISIVITALFSSCSNDDGLSELSCGFELMIEPFCSFNPKTAQTVAFPVMILKEAIIISHEEYDIEWSHDPDFKASAISVSYQQLPITARVTEKSTGCKTEVTLEKSYW